MSAPRIRRRWRLGWGYRLAVAILLPFMTVFTKHDWRGADKLEVTGGGIIVAPNHLSWFDPIVTAHALWCNDRPPRYLGKEAVFRIPVIGKIITSAGQIPVYRETRNAVESVRAAIDAVERGECVVVYPEGTITRDPDLWPMSAKTGAARIALATGAPLIPAAQWGAQEVMAPYKKQFRILPRKTMCVWFGDPVDLSDLAGRPMDTATLQIATSRLMDAITALLARIRDEQPPAERYVYKRGSQA